MANWVWLHYLCTNLETLCNGHFIDFTVKIIRISHQKNARSPATAWPPCALLGHPSGLWPVRPPRKDSKVLEKRVPALFGLLFYGKKVRYKYLVTDPDRKSVV